VSGEVRTVFLYPRRLRSSSKSAYKIHFTHFKTSVLGYKVHKARIRTPWVSVELFRLHQMQKFHTALTRLELEKLLNL
jgi:hypothetical protein